MAIAGASNVERDALGRIIDLERRLEDMERSANAELLKRTILRAAALGAS